MGPRPVREGARHGHTSRSPWPLETAGLADTHRPHLEDVECVASMGPCSTTARPSTVGWYIAV
eukprot:4326320-Heterocapsa_arctica.AAC.1